MQGCMACHDVWYIRSLPGTSAITRGTICGCSMEEQGGKNDRGLYGDAWVQM
jgi:hypothetical protein